MAIRLTSSLSCIVLAVIVSAAQEPSGTAADGQSRRVADRIRALQREAERLAGESRSLLNEVRTLEVDRDMRAGLAQQAADARAQAERELQQTTDTLSRLELQRTAQLPDMKAQLVDVYKRGRSGYARLLFSARNLREFARATRAVASLTTLNEQRLVQHRRTLDALRKQRDVFAQKARDLKTREAEARQAKAAAERALATHAARISQIDARRDLTAQYVGELQVAYDKLQQQLRKTEGGDPVAVPLLPFRGALDWPVQGRLAQQFNQPSGRLGSAAVKNGIEISAAEGTPVRAIHSGTVGFADAFTGFGNLVILDHGGNNYSLYGYLSTITAKQGTRVEGGAELGHVGLAPAGNPALYFEMRIDARSVDPVQWLKQR